MQARDLNIKPNIIQDLSNSETVKNTTTNRYRYVDYFNPTLLRDNIMTELDNQFEQLFTKTKKED